MAEKMYAFTVRGRFIQTHYVRATSVKAARQRFEDGYTDESDDWSIERHSVKRAPEHDRDDVPNPSGLRGDA